MKGKLYRTNEGWFVKNVKTIKNCFGCKPYDIIDEYPLHPDDLDLEELKEGEVEFDIVISALDFVTYATLIPLDENGYPIYGVFGKENWDNVFKEIEGPLNIDLPIRLKNWLRNTYLPPIKK